jgi:hypothetical protein
MRQVTTISLGLFVVTAVTLAAAVQQEHGSSQSGSNAMGFDQGRTTHHFTLYEDGGAIEVTANHPADAANRDAIGSHLQHIVTMFASGNFDAPMLVHDSNNVPGTKVMAQLKDRIRYTYVELPAGGRVNIVTSDREAIDAVHEFLRFQITEHKTGDSTEVRSR